MKKLIYYEWGILPHISIGFFSIILIVTSISFSVRISNLKSDEFGRLIAPVIFFILGVVGIVFGFILLNVKKRQKIIDNWSYAREGTQESEKEIIFTNDLKKELSEVRNKEAIDWNKIHPLIVKKRNVDEKCPICKLLLEREDFIVQCPHCSQIFHGKHLIEWLLEQKNCPICRKRIDIR